MKKPLLSLLVLASLLAIVPLALTAEVSSAGPADAPLVTTLLSDGSTNTWTQADLVAALQLMNRKYHRDVQSESGRRAWHGKRLSRVTDAESFTITETYEDGAVFVDPAPITTPEQAVAEHNSKRTTTMTNGIPVRLAESRIRRLEERATTNTVTNITTPDPN